jgi:AbrB family looped-hinge helix DNA binding protein
LALAIGNLSKLPLPDRDKASAMEVKIDDYGRIVIPKEVREKLGIESGSTLEVRVGSEV